MAEPKNKKALLSLVTEAVAEYCYQHDDRDFSIDLAICAEDGWANARIANE